MGKLPGINHARAIKALQRAGFEILRQSGHVVLWDGAHTVVVPRNNPVDAVTMYRLVRDAGLTPEQFRKLL